MTDSVRVARQAMAFPFIVLAVLFAFVAAGLDGLAASIEPRERPREL